MFRPAFAVPFLAVSALALGACSPDNLASAGDSTQAIGIVAMADPSLPPPSEQALAPICAPASEALVTEIQQQLNA